MNFPKCNLKASGEVEFALRKVPNLKLELLRFWISSLSCDQRLTADDFLTNS